MDSYTFGNGHEGEYRVSGLRVAALGEVEVDVLDVHIHLDSQSFQFASVDVFLVLGMGCDRLFVQRHVYVAQAQDILLAQRKRLVHIRYGLVAAFLGHTSHVGLVVLYLPVLEASFQQFASGRGVAILNLLELLTYLVLGLAAGYVVEPVGIGVLVGRREYLHLVAVLERLAYGDLLVANAATHTVATYVAMDRIREVEHRRSCGQSL